MAVICRELGILFLCVPKTGCSAVAEVFIEHYGGEWLPPHDIISQDGSLACCRKHGSVDDLLNTGVLTPNHLSRLTVVATTRHPLDWLISQYYYSRSVYEAEGEFSELPWVRRDLDVYRDAATSSLENHVERHWLGYRRSVSWRWAKRANVILGYENLQQELDALLRHHGVPYPKLIPLVNQTPRRPRGISTHFPQKLATRIQEVYSDDFRRFGYELTSDGRSAHISGASVSREMGPRILLVDDVIPAQRLGYGYPRSLEILRGLADLGCCVTLFPSIDQTRREPELSELQQRGIEVVWSADERLIDFRTFLEVNSERFDVVWVSRFRNLRHLGKAARSTAPNLPVVFDAECLTSVREACRRTIFAPTQDETPIEELFRTEMEAIANADLIVTVSEGERRTLAEHGCSSKILGHRVDTDPTEAPFHSRTGLLFVGRFAGPMVPRHLAPNEDALQYFCLNILPIIRRFEPLELSVVGAGSEQLEFHSFEGIHAVGEQRWLGPYYEKARVFVAPTRFSAGIPLKVIEAMAAGLPTVVTSHLSTQLDFPAEAPALVANDDKSFAEGVLTLHRDEALWSEYRRRGIAFAASIAGAAGFRRQLAEIARAIEAINPRTVHRHKAQ